MQIIFGDNVNLLKDRFTVLELDTFCKVEAAEPITAWCVVTELPLQEINILEHLVKLHQDLVSEWKKQNWNFCLQALNQLKGRWNGELDSFYQNLEERIQQLIHNPPDHPWSPMIIKTS